jgi:hypothetical protein
MTANALAKRAALPAGHSVDYLLIDGSSSMLDKWDTTVAALETYITDIKAAKLNSHVLASVFTSEDCDMLQRDTPLTDFISFYDEPISSHWGLTPLYDAINAAARRLRDLDPSRATLLICTDGEENASSYTDLTQAKAILDWCRAKGWQVIFIGCDFNNSSQAKALGANEDKVIGVQRELLVDAARELAKKRANYGISGTEIHFTEAEQRQFGGLLSYQDPSSVTD